MPTVSSDINAFMVCANKVAAKESLELATTQPFVIAFKNVTVLTAATPADIASVTLPAWCTRFRLATAGHMCVAESAAGTLAGAALTVQDTAAGAGAAISGAFAGNSGTNAIVLFVNSSTSVTPSTTGTIYLRQTANSANAGTISVYLTIVPLL